MSRRGTPMTEKDFRTWHGAVARVAGDTAREQAEAAVLEMLRDNV